jgi:hypothetical protein
MICFTIKEIWNITYNFIYKNIILNRTKKSNVMQKVNVENNLNTEGVYKPA